MGGGMRSSTSRNAGGAAFAWRAATAGIETRPRPTASWTSWLTKYRFTDRGPSPPPSPAEGGGAWSLLARGHDEHAVDLLLPRRGREHPVDLVGRRLVLDAGA